ncbi:hypothetical protein [Plantibacter sp. LMC-P-059a]|nr:hypothetical protein [Plantibacter sp. LMC-P-059a]
MLAIGFALTFAPEIEVLLIFVSLVLVTTVLAGVAMTRRAARRA